MGPTKRYFIAPRVKNTRMFGRRQPDCGSQASFSQQLKLACYFRKMERRISRALIATIAVSGLLLTGITVAPAWAVPSYPSAAEVAAAKKNVTAKKAMIARLEKIIADLAAEAADLGRTAQIKGESLIRNKKKSTR